MSLKVPCRSRKVLAQVSMRDGKKKLENALVLDPSDDLDGAGGGSGTIESKWRGYSYLPTLPESEELLPFPVVSMYSQAAISSSSTTEEEVTET